MKYAIYDKAAAAYLTKMEFEVGYSEHTQFECRLNEYITKAQLLDTKEAADAAVVRIERFKFMGQPGRFVVHSFDDTLIDQYVISEAGNPTKVVDNITVDLDGTINVKYGTMMSHWSTMLLENAVNRMFVLQNAASDIYTSWSATFDICKVITIIDEKEHTHYQFIKVTDEGIEKYSKDEKEKLLVVGKEITDITDPLNKRIEELEKANYELGERVVERGTVVNRLLDENNSLKNKVESIKKEAHDWKKLYENADADREELKNVIDIIHTDLVSTTACNDLKDTLNTIYHNSGLNHISMENFLTAKDETCSIINHVIAIMESRELNKKDHIYAVEEIPKAIAIRDSLAEVIFAIRNAIYHNDSDAFRCIENRMKFDHDFNSNPFMAGVRENIKDICAAEKKNIANHDLKNSEIARLTDERDKALERAEKLKGIANSIYGMTIPTRCCGKQVMADILSGKKIPISKDKYESILTSLKLIDLSYEGVYGTTIHISPKPKPIWLPGLMREIKNLTE